ncbi:MAG TPA: hypothetical protein PKY81_13795 [bacterium]|nr:hypothetical protein [bacterium]HPN32019.1 hypothetical protein [bacterium]
MLDKKIFLLFFFFLLNCIPIKHPIFSEREKEYFVYKNSELIQDVELDLNLNLKGKVHKVKGIIIVLTLKENTNIAYKIEKGGNTLIESLYLAEPAGFSRKYQAVKIMFKKDVFLDSDIKLFLKPDKDLFIWYGGEADVKNRVTVDGVPVEGKIYLDFIKSIQAKDKLREIYSKITENFKFNIFYLIIIILIISGIRFFSKQNGK